jgi:histidine triad (HIT) family protein
METCVFCSIVKENKPHHEIWYEDENHIAFLDVEPRQKGHTLVIPKKHTDNILDMTSDDYTELFRTCHLVSNKLKNWAKCNRIAIVVDGYSVGHVHVHLIPTNKGEDLWEARNTNASASELREIADLIKSF